jgi:hypothetical protein
MAGVTLLSGESSMRRILIMLGLLATLPLAGCATQKRSDTLTTTLNAYASTLRWGDFASGAQFIEPKMRLAHPVSAFDKSLYQQVRVSDYDSGAGPVPLDDADVQQTVKIGLINVHTQSERTIVDHQTWHYDEKTRHWWLTSGLPDITRQ